jgi:hypothetical protein
MFFGERIVRFIVRKARAGIASDVGMEAPWDRRTHTGLCHRHNRDLIAYRALDLPIPLNRLVDVYALVANKKFPHSRVGVLIAATFIKRRSG